MVDAAHDKESRARDTINQLKLEIANLTKLVEQGAGLGIGQDSSVQELVKQKDELISKRDSYLEEIVQVRSSLIVCACAQTMCCCSFVRASKLSTRVRRAQSMTERQLR